MTFWLMKIDTFLQWLEIGVCMFSWLLTIQICSKGISIVFFFFSLPFFFAIENNGSIFYYIHRNQPMISQPSLWWISLYHKPFLSIPYTDCKTWVTFLHKKSQLHLVYYPHFVHCTEKIECYCVMEESTS